MSLPNELYVKIFEKLKLKEKIKLSSVSKLFNQLNSTIEHSKQIKLMTAVEVPEYITNIKLYSDQNFNRLKQSNQIKKLDISRVLVPYKVFNSMNLQNVESLTLRRLAFNGENIDTSVLVSRIKRISKLRKLSLLFDEEPETYLEFINQISHSVSLKLRFDGNVKAEDLECLSRFDNIIELNLIDCFLCDKDLVHLEKFKNLKKLTLPGTGYNLEFTLKDIKGLKIRELKIDCIQEEKVYRLKKFPELRSLDLTIENLNGLIFLDKVKKLKKLKLNLHFIFFTKLNVKIIKLLNVKHLKLNITSNLCSSDVHLLKKLKNLKSLKLHTYEMRILELKVLKSLRKLNITIWKSSETLDLIEVVRSTEIKKLKIHLCDKMYRTKLKQSLPNTSISLV
jgi:hypothetical protein